MEAPDTHTVNLSDTMVLRIDRGSRTKIAQLARKNERSVSAQVRVAIREHLEREAA